MQKENKKLKFKEKAQSCKIGFWHAICDQSAVVGERLLSVSYKESVCPVRMIYYTRLCLCVEESPVHFSSYRCGSPSRQHPKIHFTFLHTNSILDPRKLLRTEWSEWLDDHHYSVSIDMPHKYLTFVFWQYTQRTSFDGPRSLMTCMLRLPCMTPTNVHQHTHNWVWANR